MRLRKNNQYLWLAVPAIALIAAIYYFISQVFVPENFNKARAQSAEIAKEIVSLTEESIKKLDEISLEDRQYNFGKALALVREELKQSKDSSLKAFELTEELGGMIRAAAGITPTKARNLALDAIGQEMSLIRHLNNYNAILNSLLQTLELKFSGDIRYDADDVQKLIKNMNEEVREINKLNSLFNEKMGQFDNITK